MITLDLVLPDTRYPIHIGNGLLQRAELIVPHLAQKKALIVTNTIVAPLYLETVLTTLERAGIRAHHVILPDGEAHKTQTSLDMIFDALFDSHAERKTSLIALGGGVVGDMTGFAAACWQRGAPFIQIPTTLLAQVDSSVGGKTAINHPKGKNMIGAFHQPRVVIADLETLNTLPAREFSAGLAEIIKYGLLGNIAFLDWLERHMDALLQRNPTALAEAVRMSCQMKADIVRRDEKEHGERALLNLGHTFGHAIESGLGYGTWLHGEAVAAGMMLAAETSRLLGWLTEADVQRVQNLLNAAHLPTSAPNLGVETWFQLINHDKKVENGIPRFVLFQSLGTAVIHAHLDRELLTQVFTGRLIAENAA